MVPEYGCYKDLIVLHDALANLDERDIFGTKVMGKIRTKPIGDVLRDAAVAEAVSIASSPGHILVSLTMTSRGLHVTPALPKKFKGRFVVVAL